MNSPVRHRPYVLSAVLLGGALFAPAALADVIDTSGQEPWERCGYCHGIDGVSSSPSFPNLAGQRSDYLRKQLRDFRDGRRTNSNGVMATQAEGLDRETIAQLADYFAGQPPAEPAEVAASAQGETLYHKGDRANGIPACAACHAEGGHGIPSLAGQKAAYVAKQLDDFAEGRRTNAPAGTMDVIAKKLSPQQRVQLANYVASLPGGAH